MFIRIDDDLINLNFVKEIKSEKIGCTYRLVFIMENREIFVDVTTKENLEYAFEVISSSDDGYVRNIINEEFLPIITTNLWDEEDWKVYNFLLVTSQEENGFVKKQEVLSGLRDEIDRLARTIAIANDELIRVVKHNFESLNYVKYGVTMAKTYYIPEVFKFQLTEYERSTQLEVAALYDKYVLGV